MVAAVFADLAPVHRASPDLRCFNIRVEGALAGKTMVCAQTVGYRVPPAGDRLHVRFMIVPEKSPGYSKLPQVIQTQVVLITF